MSRVIAIITSLCFIGCSQQIPEGTLPILGHVEVIDGDTIRHTIPDWNFLNQDSTMVTNRDLADHIYITDFFFTSCFTICPKVMKQMLKLHDEFKDEDLVKLTSFTVDPKRDHVERLSLYAHNLGVSSDKWHFLTGEQDSLYALADDYFIVAYEDPEAPGGFDHSGKIILTDKSGHVRAFCEGTDPESVEAFIPQVYQLMQEYTDE